jgi:23S rRNA pseudouridine2605 synthase
MRLHVFLAKAGIASRRAGEKLILAGRVKVNGRLVTALGVKVEEQDRVTLDDRPVAISTRRVYLAVHKPVAVLCTQRDDRNRPKVIDFIPADLRPGLFHVGRLDFMSSGLIFYTNDGLFAKIVAHPSSQIEKEYLLETLTPIPPRLFPDYRKGIRLDDEYVKITQYALERNDRARLVLTEGKNREIRRVCDAYGVKVKRLVRVRIGTVHLAGIATGRFRHLRPQEVAWFLAQETRSRG